LDDRKQRVDDAGPMEWFMGALRIVEFQGGYFDDLSRATAASAPPCETR
jgi:hypothetical protein